MSNKELFARVKEAMQAAEEAGGPRDLTEYTSLMDDIIEECKKRKAAAFVNEIEAAALLSAGFEVQDD
jgi:hypothetical protein